MIRHSLFVLGLIQVALISPLPSQEATTRPRLSFEEAMGPAGAAAYRTRLESPLRWASDGVHLDLGDGRWLHPETGEETSAPEREAQGTEAEAPRSRRSAATSSPLREVVRQALEEARGGKELPGQALRPRAVMSTLPRTPEPDAGLVTSPDGGAAACLVEGELWFVRADGSSHRLLENAQGLRRIELAPGGETISFLRGFDLHLVRTRGGSEIPLSRDGSENLFYGELDWVYQEEVYGRFDFKATWWSPDGDHLAFMRIDEGDVQEFTVVDHIPYRLEVERLKYPKAGDPNPRATLHLARAVDGTTVPVDLSRYAPEEQILIVRVTWTPDGRKAVLQVQDREQRWLDLNLADPATGKLTTLFRETSRSWVNVLGQPHWLKSGGFLWESERTGYRHLYRYDEEGKLLHPLTSGEWQVTDLMQIDEEREEVLFSGTKDGAVDTNIYRVGLDGEGLRRLTQGPGSHQVSFNHDRSFFLDTVSALDNPGEQRLCRGDGTVVKVVARALLPPAQETYGLSLPELVSIPARDGYPLDATVTRPVDFDPTRPSPVWIETYSGPDSPSVRNRWSLSPWSQFLAQQGYVLLQVNVRSASGRGQHHTDACYQRFGVSELSDLEDAVAWLTAHPWADAERVGITGWSYGGYMAAYALTHSQAFKLGIAGGGVYDWRDYDTIYTERYMRMPQNNEEGYRVSSCVAAADELHGHLLIVHGTMDDNVHMQNAMQFVFALQKAGKDFELMLYPKSRHGIRDPRQSRHLRSLIWKTIRERL